MARYTGAVCRFCRREGIQLFLKGERCYTEKCAIDRKAYPPGQHGQLRIRFSEYGTQLREKQKVKRVYGLAEAQFHGTFEQAERSKGITGETLLVLLERRLDNIVYRLGFASSRGEARVMVRHGHILVNGKRKSLPSLLVKPGDVIEVALSSRSIGRIQESLEGVVRRGMPSWLELQKEAFRGTVRAMPRRADLTTPPIQERLVVELYSR